MHFPQHGPKARDQPLGPKAMLGPGQKPSLGPKARPGASGSLCIMTQILHYWSLWVPHNGFSKVEAFSLSPHKRGSKSRKCNRATPCEFHCTASLEEVWPCAFQSNTTSPATATAAARAMMLYGGPGETPTSERVEFGSGPKTQKTFSHGSDGHLKSRKGHRFESGRRAAKDYEDTANHSTARISTRH